MALRMSVNTRKWRGGGGDGGGGVLGMVRGGGIGKVNGKWSFFLVILTFLLEEQKTLCLKVVS